MILEELAASSAGWARRTSTGGHPVFDANRLGHPCNHLCSQLRSVSITVSVVIPSWNSCDSLLATLHTIERSSLNRLAPSRLQVIVCDDGSTDGTVDRVRRAGIALNLELLSLTHRGQSYSINSGVAHADGDVLVICDSDMLLGCGALDELVSRVERDSATIPFGFRSDISAHEYPADAGALWELMHREALSRDTRFHFHMPTLTTNLMIATEWTTALEAGRSFVDCEGSVWRRHRFLFGALFAVTRDRFLAIGGMPTILPRWGFQDTLVAARLEAADGFLLPVLAAHGHHVAHAIRHPDQWFQYHRNRLGYDQLLATPMDRLPWSVPKDCSQIAIESPRASSTHAHEFPSLDIRETANTRFALGLWDDCLALDREVLLAHELSQCLFRAAQYDELIAHNEPTFWQAVALGRAGANRHARKILSSAASRDPVADYVAGASPAELEYLINQYDRAGLDDVADLHREARALMDP